MQTMISSELFKWPQSSNASGFFVVVIFSHIVYLCLSELVFQSFGTKKSNTFWGNTWYKNVHQNNYLRCVGSLSISEMQLRSWSAEQPSFSLSSMVAARVREAKESKTKSRDIMVVFILAGGEVDCSLQPGGAREYDARILWGLFISILQSGDQREARHRDAKACYLLRAISLLGILKI